MKFLAAIRWAVRDPIGDHVIVPFCRGGYLDQFHGSGRPIVLRFDPKAGAQFVTCSQILVMLGPSSSAYTLPELSRARGFSIQNSVNRGNSSPLASAVSIATPRAEAP